MVEVDVEGADVDVDEEALSARSSANILHFFDVPQSESCSAAFPSSEFSGNTRNSAVSPFLFKKERESV